MRRQSAFDPLGWLLAVCSTLLVGALMLTIAVRLLAAIWPWLLGVGVTVVLTAALARLWLCRWSQRW